MDRNHIIGFILIFATLLVFNIVTGPSKEELARRQHVQDSIALVKKQVDASKPASQSGASSPNSSNALTPAQTASKADSTITIENELVKISFGTKGGRISGVTLKKFSKLFDKDGKEHKTEVKLLEDTKNIYNLTVPTANGSIATKDLVFTPSKDGNTVAFNLQIDSSRQITQTYTLLPNDYSIDYSIQTKGIDDRPLKLQFVNYIDKIEKGYVSEQQNSTVYFKEAVENEMDYCSCTSDDEKSMSGKKINWIAHTNQFFNSSLISTQGGFSDAILKTTVLDGATNSDLKILSTDLSIPLVNGSHKMKWYSGPNDFKRLQSYNIGLEEIIPYGSSIFGSINRWVIRPLFDFLDNFISSKGLSILLIIFFIKMLLYPLLYKTLKSQAKMAALKPELTKMKEKYKDDAQKQQVESMKIYQEFGVSPFAGCFPMLAQMPIWIALFKFFPANILFRQESFLWAPDLSSYDAFFNLGFSIPFMGSHISLFTLLWAVSTLIYTYYSTKDVDMSANPAMKYVQYFMPLMFLGFFNSYASGLTCYMFLSNLINILQTIFTKKFIFDDEKIRKDLEIQKMKPKKTSGFQAKLQEAMKMQQQMQEQKNKQKK